ncbi:Vacuolar ATP synthase subunit C [Rhodotorula kratochvilovae]
MSSFAPSSLLLVTAKLDSANPLEQLDDLRHALANGKLGHASLVEFPQFKTGTLSSLLTLSETLAKQDPQVTTALQKTVDTIRSLTSANSAPSAVASGSSSSSSSHHQVDDRSSPLSQHLVLDDGRPYLSYIFSGDDDDRAGEDRWAWNRAKYRVDDRSLGDIVDALLKEVQSIENAQRNKSQQYALVKGQLTTALRKKTGNLSMRSLADVVTASDFASTSGSEYLETILVAVPKNLVKEWESTYERLTQMVVPRSATKLAQDDEFALFSVTIFRRVKDEFAQKAREKKFIVRDFTYDEQAIEKQKRELEALVVEEKDMWADLLRLSRINFSELFQVLVHLKVVRAYVESVLRYGLPAAYFGAVVKPEPKQLDKLLSALSTFLVPSHERKKAKRKPASGGDDDAAALGEYATLMEGEYHEFVVFEIEQVEAKGE